MSAYLLLLPMIVQTVKLLLAVIDALVFAGIYAYTWLYSAPQAACKSVLRLMPSFYELNRYANSRTRSLMPSALKKALRLERKIY